MALTKLVDLDALNMVFGGRPLNFTQDIFHYMQNIACVMKSIGSHYDLTHLDTSSHTSLTLDDGRMSSHFADMVILVEIWEGSPYSGQFTLGRSQALIDDVALAFDWTPLREMAFLFSTYDIDLSTLEADLSTFDIEHIDDNVMC